MSLTRNSTLLHKTSTVNRVVLNSQELVKASKVAHLTTANKAINKTETLKTYLLKRYKP